MVGVPGRSRGCFTCRARKKGCDQQRPHCGQCQRSNLECRGYQDSLTFVMYHDQSHSRDSSLPHPKVQTVTRPRQTPSLSTIGSFSLNHNAFESSLFDKYWEMFFPKMGYTFIPHTSDQPETQLGSWQLAIRDLSLDDKLVRMGFLAVAYSSMARCSDDERFMLAGIQTYSRVLKEVNIALQHEERRKSDNVLAVCKFLALYEASGGSGSGPIGLNWEKHTLGIQRLLLLRGPLSHSTELGHSLFRDSRYQAAIVAIRKREPYALADRDWMTVPWANTPKDFKDELVDLMVQLPGIRAEIDAIKFIRGTDADTIDRRLNLFIQFKAFQAQIHSWIKRFETSTSPEILEATKHGIPETFEVNHMVAAHALTLYWAICCIFYHEVNLACDEIPVSLSPITTEEANSDYNPTPYAYSIAKSVPYFFQEGGGTILAQSFSFPMGIALRYLQTSDKLRDSADYQSLIQGFRQGKTGKMISKFLVSLRVHEEAEKGEDEFKKYIIGMSSRNEEFQKRFKGIL